MRIRFWGVRGSVPTPEADKLKVGGNTSCVEVRAASHCIILDMGTGLIPLGKKLAQEIKDGTLTEIIILLSHTHWDHIQGLPFFAPAYIPGMKITIYGPSKANRRLELVLAGQMEYDYFPVKFSHLPAKIDFRELPEGVHQLREGVKVSARRHIHPGVAYGFRIEAEGKKLVYSTDTEHFQDMIDKRVVELSEDADLLIHDAQYCESEMGFKLGWGHSTWRQAVQVCLEAKAKKLALFHHDQDRTDSACDEIETEAKIALPSAFLAREGLEIEI